MMGLFDFLDDNNKSVIHEWAKSLEKADRAKLNSKFKQLAEMDFALAWGTKLLQGPIYKSIYKLRTKQTVQLRPLLCRGPLDNDAEYTLLEGAKEIGKKLTTGAVQRADKNRDELLANPKRRRNHVLIPL
jgi:hypothetical protein